MADDRKQGGEPVLEFSWDSLELAADQTYSTTLRINLSGWWEGGRPRQVVVAFYKRGQDPLSGNSVRIQKGYGTFPLTGLEPGHHYLVVVYIGDRLPVQKMIAVSELPKPKRPEEEALETERIRLERAKVARQLKEIEPLKPKRKLKVKASVDVLAPDSIKEEKKPEEAPRSPLSQRFREAYVQEREKGKAPVFEFKIQRRRPLIFFPID